MKGVGKGGMKGNCGKSAGEGKPSVSDKIFVGALPHTMEEDTITEYFSQFGPVKEVKMMYDEDGKSRGYCFVSFNDVETAKMVLNNYDDNRIDDKWIDCKPSHSKLATKPGDWTCPNCGDMVFARRSQCNMCGFSADAFGGKGGGGQGKAEPTAGKPGDWFCPSCGDLVFSYRDKCNRCGSAKDNNAKRMRSKKGDWTCPNCGDLVFASKVACSMCSTPKPEGMEEMGAYGPLGGGDGMGMRSAPY
eukprot:NODE_20441_length_798_cov_4.992548.p1 GENE.NODE_20441_length_798_cov_4.992548~~NODE_20441_length_798_cov_4.992548.p1  ORF type:complete len:246 (+),score=48.80 NODE_20441_length_798_cov_4.992548:54-791(+)